ncbi:hypothetical protein CEP52_011336 [Fusarium oligoseptatum]|uniref:Uncharacterized protein n=1 Tax=Fusarium oligoseptatum TaxID=2604345 RepID=A0A428T3S7_9HYPO|nr:hypothetical protein CEP52_011336 [Fusarium oligoseptatum]
MASQSSSPKDARSFRDHLPDLTIPRFTTMQKQDVYEYAEVFKENKQPPWLHALYCHWLELFKEPFKGVTNDGNVRRDLFDLQDDGIQIKDIVDATNELVQLLGDEQYHKTCYHIDSPEWRTWSNPEFLLSDKGIRLDEVSSEQRTAVMRILELTLSPEGYQKALGAMRINGFLGELVKTPVIMNEWSYNFIVISPWFTGAEPNLIDEGPYKGTRILQTEERLGLELMTSLSPEKKGKTQVFTLMKDPKMPEGRWNHDDQRHLCGAYRDNRIVPYEGILVSEMTPAQQDIILAISNEYLLYLPQKARQNRLDQIKSWFHETYFCWIGGWAEHDPFYYRIQSPVVIIEFDHHSGVFLTNEEPAKFHIHTLLRTPNGGDYGMALRPLMPRVKQEFVWKG